MVCRAFATLGIPVFNADDAARYLMEHNAALVAAIRQLLGDEVYAGNKLDRQKVASIVFNDPTRLQQLNALVHPATIQYAQDWLAAQVTPYTIKEAAIFFESGSYREMDVMVGVYAPAALRIARAMKRSQLTEEKVKGIMTQQMDEEEKMKRCNHIIINDDVQAIVPQVLRLHRLFLQG